jgi:hypothetical protein
MIADDGLKNEVLRKALAAALAGRSRQASAPLEALLCRYGGGADRAPNLRLAAAFGAEVAALPGAGAALLDRLGANDAAPDTPEVFLPIAAAHGWTALLRAERDTEAAWAALAELAADERTPVRFGTRDALLSLAVRPGGAPLLVARATDWLDLQQRAPRFAAAALIIEVLADRRVLAALAGSSALLDYLARAIDEVADAPRSAERSEQRRRLLLSLPRTLAAATFALRTGDRGASWLEAECRRARHPDVRHALSETILALRASRQGHSEALSQRLRQALEGSAKPPRDPTRRRPGAGRGKASRPMR